MAQIPLKRDDVITVKSIFKSLSEKLNVSFILPVARTLENNVEETGMETGNIPSTKMI
jgi:uncharacterized protein YerC